MTDKDNEATTTLFERCVTRREMLLTTGGALAGILISGCSGSQESSQTNAPPVAGSFVGEVPEANAFVAVVAAGAGEEGGEQDIRAYLCDGEEINEWFMGTAAENDLDLSSDGGSQLKGNLTPDTSTGQITLSDGRAFPFVAQLATGVAGLYDMTISDNGQVHGTSETGGRLEGQVAKESTEEGYPITGTITAPDGQTQEIETFALDTEPAVGRWIVLSDGRINGGKKGVSSTSRTWTDPHPNP